ncbi:MAG TPA: Gfo/Idh/MocA family oxidoreductase, partial [Gemmatimonadales bacterium]|nr:Gfo/Idh/MocA family oxidoreductase [Gemmatimonadales bacterium]
KTASATGLGLVMTSHAPGLLRSRSPSDHISVAVFGLNGRGMVHAQNFSRLKDSSVAYIADVDSTVLAKASGEMKSTRPPKAVGDFRRALEDPTVDAVSIATPDHWHAPMAILAMKAGKHVYVEKPCGHNAREGELIVEAQRKHQRVVQMGTQQRSADRSIELAQALKEGLIGRPYLARAWYANTRGTIGRGKEAPVPANLDYELWQGPAPRTPYRDNVIHYNWHWFHRWGTGEICNNGTHEIDVSRWMLGVDTCTRVISTGGRYQFDDDWEFTDTQEVTFEFGEGKTIIWQGQSCNGLPMFGRSRGVSVLGTNGSVVVDRDGYVVYDQKGQVIREAKAAKPADPLNVVADDEMTAVHIANFVAAVRTGAALHQPIAEGAKSVLLCHLGNIAQSTGRVLHIDASGHIIDDAEAMKQWQREYAPGWMPVV